MATGFLDNSSEGDSGKNKKEVKGETPVLSYFGKDLTGLALEGKLDPVIGRDSEINQMIGILNKRKKNNPIIVGEAGVGKTSIVEGLAIRIVNGEVDRALAGKRIFELNINSLVAGTKFRGQFEERLEELLKELEKNRDIIIFIDEIHNIIGAGGTSGSMDAANILKPALSRGDISCIGSTTLDEYKKHIESDSALERRFQKVYVNTPSAAETLEIISKIRSKYQDFHKVSYSEEILHKIVELADRYMPYRNFPDKAIDLLDEVGSFAKTNKIVTPENIRELLAKKEEVYLKKSESAMRQDYEEAARMRDEERILLEKISTETSKWQKHLSANKYEITLDDVAHIISMHTGIPLEKLTQTEIKKIADMETYLADKVIGQTEAVAKIAQAIQRSKVGIQDPNKPLSSFLLLGSTGVGKSLLAKELAKFLFHTEDSFVRLDMSEYMEPHSVSKIIGSPPGYVGFENKGQLTEKIKNRPYSVVLFDEIEKANPEVYNILLQILDEGRLTDSHGKVIDFKNCIIIMTSNIGSDKLFSDKKLGFSDGSSSDFQQQTEKIFDELKKKFRPELINRIDEKVVFKPLDEEDILKVTDIELSKLAERLENKNLSVTFTKEVKKFLADTGYDKEYGARPLKRAISNYIENIIAKYILASEPSAGTTIKIVMDKKENLPVIK